MVLDIMFLMTPFFRQDLGGIELASLEYSFVGLLPPRLKPE